MLDLLKSKKCRTPSNHDFPLIFGEFSENHPSRSGTVQWILKATVVIKPDLMPSRINDPSGKLRREFRAGIWPEWMWKLHDPYTIQEKICTIVSFQLAEMMVFSQKTMLSRIVCMCGTLRWLTLNHYCPVAREDKV